MRFSQFYTNINSSWFNGNLQYTIFCVKITKFNSWYFFHIFFQKLAKIKFQKIFTALIYVQLICNTTTSYLENCTCRSSYPYNRVPYTGMQYSMRKWQFNSLYFQLKCGVVNAEHLRLFNFFMNWFKYVRKWDVFCYSSRRKLSVNVFCDSQ